MSKGLRVLVVGASIAGPSTAYWFARTGATVTVIERYPQFRAGGQNVDIRNVGVTVMRKTPGLEAAIKAKLSPMEGMSLVSSTGAPYGVIKATGNPDQQSLVSEYEIFRDDLSKILYDLTEHMHNVRYVFGEQVSSISQSHDTKGADVEGPVMVEFANGILAPSEFDLVVACDGSTSRTRAIGLGCGVRDYVHSMGSWSAFFSTKEDLLEGSLISKGTSAVRGRCMAIGPGPQGKNTRAAFMKFWDNKSIEGAVTRERFRKAQKNGTEAMKKFVADEFAGVAWKGEQALREMMDAEDFYAGEWLEVKPPTLSKGRFAMVGDAGYGGCPGEGTSLAMTGAYLLAGEISKNPNDLTKGLEGYERLMRPLIKDMQTGLGLVPYFMAPQTQWGIWIRNTLFSIICRSGIIDFAQRFLGNAMASSDKYKLPDYDWKN